MCFRLQIFRKLVNFLRNQNKNLYKAQKSFDFCAFYFS